MSLSTSDGIVSRGISLALASLGVLVIGLLRGVHPPFIDEEMAYPHFMGAWARLDDARIEEVIRISRRYGMAYTPTFIAVKGTLSARDWEEWRRGPTMSLWPRRLRDGFWSGEVGLSPTRFMRPEDFSVVEDALRQMKRTTRALHAAGIPIHTGTDSNAPNVVPGASLHDELEIFVDLGLSPEDSLALSTRDSPKFLGVEAAGALAAGAPANLAIFQRDPTKDLRNLSTLMGVVADGRLYLRSDLDARLARYAEHYAGTGYSIAVMPALRTGMRIVTSWMRD